MKHYNLALGHTTGHHLPTALSCFSHHIACFKMCICMITEVVFMLLAVDTTAATA